MAADPSNFTEKASNTNKSENATPDNSLANELRGFGIIGLLSILIILASGNLFISGIVFIPLGGIMVLFWTLLSKTPWSALGYIPQKRWLNTIIFGILLGIGFKLLMKTIVMPILGASPMNDTYHFLVGNKSMLIAALFFMAIAGLAEETVFRGFLFERLGKLFKQNKWSKMSIVLITAALFGLGHVKDQGLAGFEQATIVGLVYGILYAATGNLWLLIIAHASFDISAVIIIYNNLETTIAHFFFGN